MPKRIEPHLSRLHPDRKGIELAPNLPGSVGNQVQGDGLTFDGHLTLEQTTTAH